MPARRARWDKSGISLWACSALRSDRQDSLTHLRAGLLTTSTDRCGGFPVTACRAQRRYFGMRTVPGLSSKIFRSRAGLLTTSSASVGVSSAKSLRAQRRYFGMRTVPGLGSSIRAGLLTTSNGRCGGFPVTACRGSGGTSVCALYRGSVLRSFVHGLELAGQWRYFGMRTVPGLGSSLRAGLLTTKLGLAGRFVANTVVAGPWLRLILAKNGSKQQ
jgi:hypothetical protein